MSQKIKHIKLIFGMFALAQMAIIKNQLSNNLRSLISEIYVRFIDAEKPAKMAQEYLSQISQIMNLIFLAILILVVLFYQEYNNKAMKAFIVIYAVIVSAWYFAVSFMV